MTTQDHNLTFDDISSKFIDELVAEKLKIQLALINANGRLIENGIEPVKVEGVIW